MNSIITRKKNKWFNQQIRKRYNRKQYKHKHRSSEKNNDHVTYQLKKIKYSNKPNIQKQPVKQPDDGYDWCDYEDAYSLSSGYTSRHRHIPTPSEITQSIYYWFNSPYTPKRRDAMDNNDKISYLICGYSPYELPFDIYETIRKYSWYKDLDYSLKCIETTHYLAQYIDKYINSEENKCPYSNNEDFNLLEHIYIRGGALRDCYLLREINDIDLVIDTHQLSKRFINHLIKYHMTIEQQQDCKCIYWRRYMQKFKRYRRNHISEFYQPEAKKILALKTYVVIADFLINARFIVDILRTEPDISVKSAYHGQHWVISVGYAPYNYSDYVQFDLVDGPDNSQGIEETFEEYGTFNDLSKDEIALLMTNIKKFDESITFLNRRRNTNNKRKWISVPIYPFPMNYRWYDFTINACHINLKSVLTNSNGMNDRIIDYYWDNKLINKVKHNGMNKFNILAIEDMKAKIIRGPDLEILNGRTAEFYFWRFVKLTQKFIDKINAGIWKIDKQYLSRVQELYPYWFNGDMLKSVTMVRRFLSKLLKWGINCNDDVLKRFKVFRVIGFEDYFKKMLERRDSEYLINTIKGDFPVFSGFAPVFKTCFHSFGYSEIYNPDTKYNLFLFHFI